MAGKRRCLAWGDASLVVQCATVARSRGLDIVAVASADAGVLALAADLGFDTLDTAALERSLADELVSRDVSVLLNIAHLSMIGSDVLDVVEHALNFHDGPLPEYSGLNVTTWALHHGRTEHAVNWHYMTSDVDAGPVVATETFAVRSDETAYSLNTRCYEAALSSFDRVVDALLSDDIVAAPQSSVGRHVYRRNDRPSLLIDWSATSEQIDRTARALMVGDRRRNEVGMPRFIVDSTCYVATSVAIIDNSTDAAPGTVIAADDDLQVAVRGGTIGLGRLHHVHTGQQITATALLERHDLRVGSVIAGRIDELVAAAAAVDAALAAEEQWWWNTLGEIGEGLPAHGPHQSSGDVEPGAPEHLVPIATLSDPDAVVALVAAWSCGVANTSAAILEFSSPATRSVSSAIEPLVRHPLVRLEPSTDVSFADWRSACQLMCSEAASHGAFLGDLPLRDPTLRDHSFVPAAVVHLQLDAHEQVTCTAPVQVEHRPNGTIELRSTLDEQLTMRIAAQLRAMTESISADPDVMLHRLPLLGELDIEIISAVNDTAVDLDLNATIDSQIASMCAQRPNANAVSCGDTTLTFAELAHQVDLLTGDLQRRNVERGDLVGIALPRGCSMLVGVLAVLRLGAAYVPLDPEYPLHRLQFMIQDAGLTVVLADAEMQQQLKALGLDAFDPSTEPDPSDAPVRAIQGAGPDGNSVAYVIYTSGSTGTPKGVEIEHRSVVNFFAAMDVVLEHQDPGVWLAVTSLSFDISVLELLWTLSRGYHVVIHRQSLQQTSPPQSSRSRAKTGAPSFSLFYFAAGDDVAENAYRLVLESAAWADRNGLESVWLPERHFHSFGGSYPNPSVIAAAIAATTERISIRAGSVVLPLHSPIRVAEEWSMVDNLSAGRVGLSFAPGWQPDDFVLNPAGYARAREDLASQIEAVQALWRGDALEFEGPKGMVSVSTLPRPRQAELPTWITSAGTTATFERAGALGVNVLTHLLGQSPTELTANIAAYRTARQQAGHVGDGHVTVMVHTFLATSIEESHAVAREPLKAYLSSATGLLRNIASEFPTFRGSGESADEAFRSMSESELDDLLTIATERYLGSAGLFGTANDAAVLARELADAGADEIACLVDFGIPLDDLMGGLEHLTDLRQVLDADARADEPADETGEPTDASVARLAQRHGVTHLQCTPSLAAMLAADPENREMFEQLDHLLVGGEALPVALAAELRRLVSGRLTNMYGPTETTIWSLTEDITTSPIALVPIGRPVANTTISIVNSTGREVPVGSWGELHIGGSGLARGYHGRSALTDERFVVSESGERRYATGDIVRLHPTGHVEFGGRTDAQVKIRGHRIELGEIEATLDACPDVAQSFVVTPHAHPGEIVAYVVPASGTAFDAEAIRSHVAGLLPKIMIPSAVVRLDEVPTTPNGKTDRKALAARSIAQPSAAPDPSDFMGMQSVVAGIWATTLERDAGLDDNFFDVGGHSLRAVSVFRQVVEATDLSVALTDVFRFPTIRTFATHLDTLAGAQTGKGPSEEPSSGTDRGARRRQAIRRGTSR